MQEIFKLVEVCRSYCKIKRAQLNANRLSYGHQVGAQVRQRRYDTLDLVALMNAPVLHSKHMTGIKLSLEVL